MKETGIVRRIDELGRVVIPKELRKTLGLKEGEQMEIFTTGEKELVLKKYSALGASSQFVQAFCKALAKATGKNAVVCDNSTVLGGSGGRYDKLIGEEISKKLYDTLERRKQIETSNPIKITEDSEIDCNGQYIVPLIVAGDLYGGLLLCSDKEITSGEAKMCCLVADMIACTLE